MNMPFASLSKHPAFFEYCYCEAKQNGPDKTLVVSFPGRKSNRLLDSSDEVVRPFLYETLTASIADVLFVRSVYSGDPSKANLTNDYDMLPEFIEKIKTEKKINRLVLFGFSLGCSLCLWLGRRKFVDELVLISPGEPILPTLSVFDDLRWEQDFMNFCGTGQHPQLHGYRRSVRTKILQGLNLEADRPREHKLLQYLECLIPHAEIEMIPNVGHYIPQHWKDKGILTEEVLRNIEIPKSNEKQKPHNIVWNKLDCADNTHSMQISSGNSLPLYETA